MVKKRNKSMDELNEKCNFSKNTVSQSAKSQDGMKARRLLAIAEFLDCSLDYLFGRIDNPEAHKSANVIGGLSNNSGIVGNVGNTINATAQNWQAALIDIFNDLDPVKQAKLLVYADGLKGE